MKNAAQMFGVALLAASLTIAGVMIVKPADETPTPTPTVTVTAEPQPAPTVTAEPSQAPAPAHTQEPSPSPSPSPAAPQDAELISGTVRYVNKTTWVVIQDDYHQPSGFGRVEVRSDRLRVYYTFTAQHVSSMQVTPDDAFAAAGVRMGASVGLGYVDIFFYMGASSKPVGPGLLSRKGANVWITGVFDEPATRP